ncbi:hypothetical protein CB1_002201001 [Camelus ferus]|nr:hypothetical protein CB1_002201001 [Camelus ferus]
MKGCRGIENPAFVASSPDTPRRLCASPSNVEVSVLSTNTRREDSQPQEPQDPQKSPEPPLSSVTPAGSQERPRPESLSEFEEGPCGWGTFQPQCLQRCNTPQGFLFHYCLLALTQVSAKVFQCLDLSYPKLVIVKQLDVKGQRNEKFKEIGHK